MVSDVTDCQSALMENNRYQLSDGFYPTAIQSRRLRTTPTDDAYGRRLRDDAYGRRLRTTPTDDAYGRRLRQIGHRNDISGQNATEKSM